MKVIYLKNNSFINPNFIAIDEYLEIDSCHIDMSNFPKTEINRKHFIDSILLNCV